LSGAAVALILTSALLHAGWNYLSKRRTATTAFFLVANLGGALFLSPVVVLHRDVLPSVPSDVWRLLALTGLFQAVYCAALAGAYRSGDMSLAYPLARSSPVIVVILVSTILGEGGDVSGACALGACLVVVGCFFVPLRSFADLRVSSYLNRTCALAACAALATAGYSITDDEALRRLRAASRFQGGPAETALLYACLEALSSVVWLLAYLLGRAQGRQALGQVWTSGRWSAVLTGVVIYLTYGLVLVSLAHVANVSYVVAFRQASIPIGVAMGVVWLREPLPAPKAVGVALLLAGLVLVALN
jgi:drug/metabolite transporter (DMT)-like permease